MSPTLTIEVAELVKRFGKITAVDGVSFSIPEGEIFGFLGPNGAGKTTTINVLCTLLRPTSGKAWVCGYDVTRQPGEVRRSIGLVFQDPSLDDRLTAKENLGFHCHVYNVPSREAKTRMEEVLRIVELWERRNDQVRTFSGGMKRRLEIARGLMHYPRVLFLDEPTLGLDPQTRAHIWNYVLKLRQSEGLTIFLTTHYMDEANHADRIAIIDHGRIVALDSPAALKAMVGGDVINLRTADDDAAAAEIGALWGLAVQRDGDGLHFEVPHGEEFIPDFISKMGTHILSVSLHRPTLDDVFLKATGHAIRDEEADAKDAWKSRMRAVGRRL